MIHCHVKWSRIDSFCILFRYSFQYPRVLPDDRLPPNPFQELGRTTCSGESRVGKTCSGRGPLAASKMSWWTVCEITFNKLLTYHCYGNKVLVVKTIEICNVGENVNFPIFIFFMFSMGKLS